MNRSAPRILANTMAEPIFPMLNPAIRDTFLTGAISTAIELLESGWSAHSVIAYLRDVEARASGSLTQGERDYV